MYYSYSCPYCSKVFYVFSESREEAAKELYDGIDKHEVQYGEDKNDTKLHEYDPETETNTIYNSLQESETAPSGGYQLD